MLVSYSIRLEGAQMFQKSSVRLISPLCSLCGDPDIMEG